MGVKEWRVRNPSGERRVVVTKELPGERWLEILASARCRVEVCASEEILDRGEIIEVVGSKCDGAIGQLTESWDRSVFDALAAAGCRVYSNYAVGFNNVDVTAATARGIMVGNTPGVLTGATAELAAALTLAAARRVVESDSFMRRGGFRGWLPALFLGDLLAGKTLGVIGAGRIGSAYARIMVEGFRMNLLYHDIRRSETLERRIAAYCDFLRTAGEMAPVCRFAADADEVLKEADVVSLHPVLDPATVHMIDARRLRLMKENAVLINASRGPLIDERALVEHLRRHEGFRAGLDVYEREPETAQGLSELANVVMVPHIGSATTWTRRGMAVLAALNVAGVLEGYPLWRGHEDVQPFLGDDPPKAVPSIVNAEELGI